MVFANNLAALFYDIRRSVNHELGLFHSIGYWIAYCPLLFPCGITAAYWSGPSPRLIIQDAGRRQPRAHNPGHWGGRKPTCHFGCQIGVVGRSRCLPGAFFILLVTEDFCRQYNRQCNRQFNRQFNTQTCFANCLNKLNMGPRGPGALDHGPRGP